jgi:hypothetical protein
MVIWNILRPIGIFYGLLVKFVVNWYIVYVLDQEKSGNPAFPHNSSYKEVFTINGRTVRQGDQMSW